MLQAITNKIEQIKKFVPYFWVVVSLVSPLRRWFVRRDTWSTG